MRAYRALLRLYPSSFRAGYAEEMCAIFAARRRAVSGVVPVIGLWVGVVVDTLKNAAGAHWDILLQDLRYAARTLKGSTGFTVTAVLVTALGVGATTATFSITDHVLIRPLPFADQHRLVKLWQNQSAGGYSRTELSPANYRDWKRMSTAYEGMAAYSSTSVNLGDRGEPARLDGASVGADLFPLLGARPILGRGFTLADDQAGAPQTLVISHGLWQGRFGGDAAVVGQTVTLDDEPTTIIGVMPPGFSFPRRDVAVWTPLRFAERAFADRADTFLNVIAKLRAGVSLEQARAEMKTVTGQLELAYPKENARIGATVLRLRDEVSEQSRLLLKALFGAALCVLLIANTNLANLLLARALVRRKEMAVRAALGGGRERLVRQLLTESLLLATGGGMLGVLLALLAIPFAVLLVPTSLPIAELPGIDQRVLAFAAAVTLLTGIAFGVVPSLRAVRDTESRGLREGARAGIGGRRERLRSALVLVEVTASVVLLVSSGLLVRALWRIQDIDPGFRSAGVLTLRTTLPLPRYEQTLRRDQFYDRVLTGVRQLPGVSSAAYVSFLPMVMRGGIWKVSTPDDSQDPAARASASLRFVTPDFFATMRIPIRGGRDVSRSDSGDAPFVAVVSDSFARRHWPGQDPLGRQFEIAFRSRTVVGVVGDIRVRGLERTSEPQVYLPSAQVPDGGLIYYAPKDVVVRSEVASAAGAAADPLELVPAVRRIIAGADPQQPISNVRMLSDIVEAETGARSAQVHVLGAFAAVAVLLASIGVYGLLAFAVSSRTQEIAVRMALGAGRTAILRLVLRRGMVLAISGVGLGVVLAHAAGRAMHALLAGVSPRDAATFGAAAAVALLAAAAGCLLPALHATRVDPMRAIRTE